MNCKDECPECKWSVVSEDQYYSYCGEPGDPIENCNKLRKLKGLEERKENLKEEKKDE